MRPVVALTGGSGGIGRAAAAAFARSGFAVLIAGRDAAALAQAEAEAARAAAGAPGAPAPALATLAADLAAPGGASAVVDTAVRRFGRLDVLVSGAAVTGPLRRPLWEVTDDAWQAVLDANLTAAWRTAAAALRHAIAAGTPLRLVQVSSGIARGAVAGLGPYGVSKWALEGLSAALAADAERAPVAVTVVTVRPPSVRSAMTRAWLPEAEAARLPGPEIVAPALLEAAIAPRERVHGRVLRVAPDGAIEMLG